MALRTEQRVALGSVAGSGAWVELLPARDGRTTLILAVGGPGTAYVRFTNAGGSPTAGMPVSAASGWVQLRGLADINPFWQRIMVNAPAGTEVRALEFYTEQAEV